MRPVLLCLLRIDHLAGVIADLTDRGARQPCSSSDAYCEGFVMKRMTALWPNVLIVISLAGLAYTLFKRFPLEFVALPGATTRAIGLGV